MFTIQLDFKGGHRAHFRSCLVSNASIASSWPSGPGMIMPKKMSGRGLLRVCWVKDCQTLEYCFLVVNDQTIPNQLEIRLFGRYPRFTMFGCRGAAVGMMEHKGRLVIWWVRKGDFKSLKVHFCIGLPFKIVPLTCLKWPDHRFLSADYWEYSWDSLPPTSLDVVQTNSASTSKGPTTNRHHVCRAHGLVFHFLKSLNV